MPSSPPKPALRRKTLTPHPSTPAFPVQRLAVAVRRLEPEGMLHLHYLLRGAAPALRLTPPAASPARRDGLWAATCFELFLAREGEPGYWEFNFSPSGDWAAYRFERYRSGRSEETRFRAIPIAFEAGPRRLRLHAALPLAALADEAAAPLRCGLSAVLERLDGFKAYWALAHPPGPPDFHDPRSFALPLL